MRTVYKTLDTLSEMLGRAVAWAALLMVLIQFALVMARYVFSATTLFGLPSIWWQEAVVYLHATLILLAAGYTFLHDGHVRVDIFYAKATPRGRDWTDLGGSLLLLLPVCVLIWWSAWPNVAQAWTNAEGSPELSGIPYKYVLKAGVLVFAGLLGLQAISIALKAGLRLLGHASGGAR